jgi:hypothetical protein
MSSETNLDVLLHGAYAYAYAYHGKCLSSDIIGEQNYELVGDKPRINFQEVNAERAFQRT